MAMFWYMSQASGIPLLKSSSFELQTSTAGESDTIIDSDYSNMSTSLDEDLEEQFVPDSDYISVLVDEVAQLIPDSEYISFWLDGEEHYADASMEILYDMHSENSTREILEGEQLVRVQVEGADGYNLVAADMFGDEYELESEDVLDWKSSWFGKDSWEVVTDDGETQTSVINDVADWLAGWLAWFGSCVTWLVALCFACKTIGTWTGFTPLGPFLYFYLGLHMVVDLAYN